MIILKQDTLKPNQQIKVNKFSSPMVHRQQVQYGFYVLVEQTECKVDIS